MTEPAPSNASDQLSDEAAHWCMRMHAEDRSAEESADFERWLKQNPAHAEEYQAMLEIWEVSERLPRPQKQQRPAHSRRRQRLPAMAAAAVVVLAISAATGWYQGWLPNHMQHLQAADSTRTITLADGSQLQLNVRSSAWFANFRDRRVVKLSEGEAFFSVQHDSNHPFVVQAGQGSVTVTGTRFNVWKDANEVVVTLEEGSVKVQGHADDPNHVAYLTPGLQARYGDNIELPQISAARNGALAWREGKLVLDDLTLAEALPLLNRYLPTPLRLAGKATGELRIGGIYNIHDIDGLVRMLPNVLPIRLAKATSGEIVISRR